MNIEAWSVIGTGIAILIAIAASHRQLRGEIHANPISASTPATARPCRPRGVPTPIV